MAGHIQQLPHQDSLGSCAACRPQCNYAETATWRAPCEEDNDKSLGQRGDGFQKDGIHQYTHSSVKMVTLPTPLIQLLRTSAAWLRSASLTSNGNS